MPPLREWSGFRMVTVWIWTSLAVGLLDAVCALTGHPLAAGAAAAIRAAALVSLALLTVRWYRQRVRRRPPPGRPLA